MIAQGEKYIITKTKVLSDIMGVVKEWGVCVPPNVVSTSKIFSHIDVALMLPIQREFL